MPVIRVLEIATFYTMFMLEPVGTHALVQVCGTTPCMLRGAGRPDGGLQEEDRRRTTTARPDGKFYWQEVECLGACSNAPMAAINDYYYEDLTAGELREAPRRLRRRQEAAARLGHRPQCARRRRAGR